MKLIGFVAIALVVLVIAVLWLFNRNRPGDVTQSSTDTNNQVVADNPQAIAELRSLHDELRTAVQGMEKYLTDLNLPTDVSPERGDLVGFLERTETLAVALAFFLDRLDYLKAGTVSVKEARAFLVEIEGKPDEERDRAFHPGLPRRETVIGRLPGFYGFVVAIDNDLSQKKVPKSYAWRQTWELWKSFVYFGGMTASGGLLSRLDNISELPGVRSATRSDNYYPWDREDIAELRRIAERAKSLATANEADLETQARNDWCKMADDWLEAGSEVGQAGASLIAGLIDEMPPPDQEVKARLRQLAQIKHLPDRARTKALEMAGRGELP